MFKFAASFLLFFVLVRSDNSSIECSGDSLDCEEKKLVTFVDKLEESPMLHIIGSYVTLKKTTESGITPRSNEDIIERSLRFLSNHELSVKLPSEEARSLETDSRSSKLKKIILPLLLLLKLKAAIVIPIVLSAVALLAFKGLGASLIALAVSGAVGLKSILEHHHHHGSKISYEIVPPVAPHWSRAGMDPSQISAAASVASPAYQYE